MEIDCKTVGFFLKISKEIGKACRKSLTRAKRVSPQVSLTVFSLVADLLFGCSSVLEYAKIRTVLQSNMEIKLKLKISKTCMNCPQNDSTVILYFKCKSRKHFHCY